MIEDLLRKVLKLPPGTRKINQDLAVMRELIRPAVDQLIPFQEEKEIELMSLKYEVKSQKQGLDKILTGRIHSIYYEPMIAFAYKDYIKDVRDALLCCRTRNSEFIFRIKKKDTDVYFNGNQVSIIDGQNVMHGLRSRSILGRIRPYSSDLLSVIVKEKEAGHLFNPLRPHSPQQRAYTLMRDLTQEEENIFLGLTLHEILTNVLSNK
jgi:hypothetical protein